MNKIYVLCDYKGFFGSKYDAIPYNSGMDKVLLAKHFANQDFEAVYLKFIEIKKFKPDFWENQLVVYTSSEDIGYNYKDFIEDIILYLELCGARALPDYRFLRANNNKVFMELLVQNILSNSIDLIDSQIYGTLEEYLDDVGSFSIPVVFKKPEGAMGKGVILLKKESSLLQIIKKNTFSVSLKEIFREYVRTILYKDYSKESFFRTKFVIQKYFNFSNLDYKVLNFGNRYYVLKREAKKNDFRASGSGIRLFEKQIPIDLLYFAREIISKLNLPHCSLDIGYDGSSFFLIEIQALYFGSYTLTHSKFYWKWNRIPNQFDLIEEESTLEEVYVESIINYIGEHENTFRPKWK